ncbi:MAG TPA: FkbM family methyltransferase [Alphaproteobacteria bacterium]|jgi:FkbM family methyltransferase|nr:FkbM family methyltransferase [Alphaproteobacteria bacterium]
MELSANPTPRLALYAVERGLLKSPLVLLDVGVQGGINARWKAMGEAVKVYGVDPIVEVIDALAADHGKFLPIALGREDGEREFFVTANKYGSSFYPASDGERRVVPVRRIDSLIATGDIEAPDFIKLDCEGAEPEILGGAHTFISSRKLLGLESETSFGVSVLHPQSHFYAVHDPLVKAGLTVFDLAFSRTPRPVFARIGLSPPGIMRPNTFNMLFCRDFAYDRSHAVPWDVEIPTIDQIIKLAMIFEAYDMRDCAYDTLVTFADVLDMALPPHRAQQLLLSA